MRARVLSAALAASLALGCGDKSGPEVVATEFAEPLAGALNQTFFYLNYVDEQAGTGIRDYACGVKTYNGHAGTDITLANFAVMDSGVPVLAAAPGTVVETHDGEFDRQKRWITGAVPNYVVLRHPDGVQSRYLHLKHNSIAVNVGQQVQASDVLGYVGSSGFSDIPHLHFEVHDADDALIDPWVGACGAQQSRWSVQRSYQDAFSLYGSGLTDADLTLDLVKDPPAQVTSFTVADPKVTMWVELMNAPAGTVTEFRLYRPDGALFFTASDTLPQFYSLSWWWGWHAIPGYLTPGVWRMQYRNDGVPLAERAFVVVDTGPLPSPNLQRMRAGRGGGGVGKPPF
ncbi:MAG TPA: M23 family metallopeptidase [Gemmatimonadales bacterium]|nr:M23 family metallopeptidase [Gemmatimonadales bacterium]